MKPIRLLPVVIVAAASLLVLKGVGIVTNGGYVLGGTALAAGAGASTQAPSGGPVLPGEPTLTDPGPTLSDGSPTLPIRAESDAGAHGAGAPGSAPRLADSLLECPPDGNAGNETAPTSGADGWPAACGVRPGTNAAGDALPITIDSDGNVVPLRLVSGTESEQAVLERLSERRESLEESEAQLQMRMALVEAAEQRIGERTAALEALEARINAMVEEKKILEETHFVSVVSMYETMKPRDAAAIFDQLDMQVMLRVARAMNPRKMAPIMARMNPARAKDLTASMAADMAQPTIDLSGSDMSSLPQIVGQ